MFSEMVLEHFQRPRNAGELAGATAVVEVSNPVCGDVLRLAVIVENGVVREARFLCRGCTASIASASVLTEKMKGRAVNELKEMHAAEIAAELGGLPPASFRAAQLAEDGVKAILEKISRG
jgi:nitrogen fixation NifU-like protein